MGVFLQVFRALFSAAALSLAIPNEFFLRGLPLAALVALIPFYMALARCRSYLSSILVSALQIFTVHMLSSFWLAFFKDFAAFTLGASAIGTACIGGGFGAVFFAPRAGRGGACALRELSGLDSSRAALRPFYFAAAYTVYEYVKSIGFLAYPWGTVSSAAFSFRVIAQIADVTGVWGITFLFALFAAVCAEWLLALPLAPRSRSVRAFFAPLSQASAVCASLFAVALLYGTFQAFRPRLAQKILTAVIVQQNADPWQSSEEDNILRSERLTLDALRALEERGEKADIVVWCEGALGKTFPRGYARYTAFPLERPLVDFIKETRTPFIIGGASFANEELRTHHNAALFFDGEGNFRGSYAKIHLVPFAEVIPGAEFEWARNFLQRLVGFSAGWIAGDQYVYLDVPCEWAATRRKNLTEVVSLERRARKSQEDEKAVARLSVPICFDDAFTEVCRPLFLNGSEIFMNITDDSWSLKKSAEWQHFAIASYRAIEYRTAMARATNSGVSAALDPAGRVIDSLPLFEDAARAFKIPIYPREMTLYAFLGDWLPLLSRVFILLEALRAAFFARARDYEIVISRVARRMEKKKRKRKAR